MYGIYQRPYYSRVRHTYNLLLTNSNNYYCSAHTHIRAHARHDRSDVVKVEQRMIQQFNNNNNNMTGSAGKRQNIKNKNNEPSSSLSLVNAKRVSRDTETTRTTTAF